MSASVVCGAVHAQRMLSSMSSGVSCCLGVTLENSSAAG